MATLVGIDIGTSATKAVACDAHGRVLATASAPHSISHPRPGWSEQDPEQWWSATVRAVREVLVGLPAGEAPVRAIGLSGQMHGSVFLAREALKSGGNSAAPLRPALLWNDQRTGDECAEIEGAAGGREALVRMVGNAALTGFTAPKMLWVRRHEPEVFRRVAAICLPKDYVRLRLTGELATDVGDASGTLLFDVVRRAWHPEMCRRLDLDPSLLPPSLESAAPAGFVSAWAAAQTGLPEGAFVVAGSGDNMTSAIGAGVVEPGILAVALGTSGVIIAHAEQPVLDLPDVRDARPAGRTHTMCSATGEASGPGRWCVTGCMLAAGGSLKWCRDTLFPLASYDDLMAEAATAPPGSGGLIFLPYLTGERCPHPDPFARGGWIGLTTRHTRAHLVRAVIEGVSFAMADILRIVRSQGIEARVARLSGGGAKSALWRQVLADVLDCPVALTNSEEGPAYGAALLAGAGVGVWSSVAHACRQTVRETEVAMPRDSAPTEYGPAHRVFSSLYQDLRERFPELARIDR